ncbi:MAG: hydrogenase maturation protease [Actinomycetota bacterium]|nr:hydrogenase maturation protease [Actinomycetota bacterium]
MASQNRRRDKTDDELRVLVAGFGNVLRGDDAFGVLVAQRLLEEPIPDGVEVVEVGIGGIHLVQKLLDEVDALIVIDAVDLGRPPGTLLVLRPDVLDVSVLPPSRRRDELADMHYATPERTFMVAGALGVLPEPTLLVGCQLADPDQLGIGVSPEVSRAAEAAVDEVRRIVTELGIRWD